MNKFAILLYTVGCLFSIAVCSYVMSAAIIAKEMSTSNLYWGGSFLCVGCILWYYYMLIDELDSALDRDDMPKVFYTHKK